MDNLPLFGAPISYGVVDNIITDEEKKFLHSVEMKRMLINNGHQSENKKVLDLPELAELKRRLFGEFLMYTANVGISKNTQWRMVTSWLNIHDKGDWAQQHSHANALFTGVLYTQVDDNTGKIVFHNSPHSTNLIPSTIQLDMDEWNVCNSKTWSLSTTNNQLVFFPATLLHSVTKNESDIKRYSLAFNFFPAGTIGCDETELTL